MSQAQPADDLGTDLLGIRPHVIRTGDDTIAHGYLVTDFAEAFARCLPSPQADAPCVYA